ncbi:MAG TPA: LytTR family DNA-binding domain-containing protein [Chitinophagaceae bacterium]|nr:LytTR family DNA-binding domain-containing protein [Chitinophagaceae bacterium]
MHTLQCYLVDDESSAIENLSQMLLKHCPGVEIIGQASTVKEAVGFITTHQPDVLLLDIRMENETGFDLLKQIPGYDGSIIFVTAHDEYGVQAIKFSATDYLLKPIDAVELVAAIHKAEKKKNLSATQQQIAMLWQSFGNQKKSLQKKIALPDMDEVRYVNIADILYCKANNTYTTFHISGLAPITVSRPISDYETLLEPYEFIRPHQTWLVNKHKIVSFKKEDGGYLSMEDGAMVPVSRGRRHLVKEMF